mmetsp:Transcript_98079/g.280657  ORF Transcript_98079/g.280657 Transcript_98079/m.280657 type:complete len:100 (-) Transcript_98079:2625-2924(-)
MDQARIAAEARRLNVAVGRGSKWRTSTSEALAVINSIGSGDDVNAAAAIAHGNVNMKTSIHFAAQMRPDDGEELLAAMLSRSSAPLQLVNAATLYVTES